MPGTSASPCRPALTVLCHHFGVPSSLLRHLGTGSGMEPCPASSSDRVINTEHINQLSCLHSQSFKFLTCVRFDQELYFFVKSCLYKFSLSKLCSHTLDALPALIIPGGFFNRSLLIRALCPTHVSHFRMYLLFTIICIDMT